MFGSREKKERATVDAPAEAPRVISIPDAYYGGKNPDIYQSSETKPVAAPQSPSNGIPKDGGTVAQPDATGGGRRNVVVWVVGICVFALLTAGVSWLVLSPNSPFVGGDPVAPTPQVQQPDTTMPVQQPTTTVVQGPDVPVVTDTTTEPVVVEPEPIVTLEFPSQFLVDGADTDEDGLTDIEEPYYQSDSGVWDSDGDGYYDGQEIQYLYSPIDEAPARLIDAGIVAEYRNPRFGYRLYYPIEWEVGAVDTDTTQVLFSAITGDFVEVQVIEKRQGESFINWFARAAVGQRFRDVREATTVFDLPVYMRQDGLVAYAEDAQYIYVMVYHPNETGPISFRQTMRMMMESFRIRGTQDTLPTQAVLPQPVGTSTEEESATSL